MYLQITTLAEITDHTGTHLLPHVLKPRGQAYPSGLATISYSTLQWPRVCNPTTTTWNLWTQTISTLFMGSATGTKLHNPLGNWTQNYDTYRFWKWRLAMQNRLLHRKQPSLTPRVALQVQSQQRYLTFSPTVPTNQEFAGHPVTPTDPQCRIIPLPVMMIPLGTQEEPMRHYFTSLVDQFQQNLTAWQHPLFGPIK